MRHTVSAVKNVISYSNAVLFLLGLIGSFLLGSSLASNNVTGLRGPTLDENPFVHANEHNADITVVCILGGVAVVATIVSRRWKPGRAIVAGMWVGVMLSWIMVTFR